VRLKTRFKYLEYWKKARFNHFPDRRAKTGSEIPVNPREVWRLPLKSNFHSRSDTNNRWCRNPDPADHATRQSSSAYLRVTEAGGGLYVAPVTEPTIKDLKSVIVAAGSLSVSETSEDEEIVRSAIAQYREETRKK
jgi:hypothetical protein